MEYRFSPAGYNVQKERVSLARPGGATEEVDGVVVMFSDGKDLVTMRFTADKWAEVLEYLNNPEAVAASRSARREILRGIGPGPGRDHMQ